MVDNGAGASRRYAPLHVLLTEEAAIGAVEFRTPVEHPTAAQERGYHVDLVHRISLEHLVLSDQTDGTLGE